MKITTEAGERHVLAVTVDNEAGVLAKITGLFTARGYNIDSLTVADITENHALSRITIVTNGPPAVIDQIHAQLERLVPVHKVVDLRENGPYVERELALIKVGGVGELRAEALRLADAFRAQIVDATTESFVFEVTGASTKIDRFVELMKEIGLDMSNHKPWTVEDLEDWEGLNFDLIVTLSPEAHHSALEFTRGTATEVEYWPMPDPSAVEGSRENRLDAYRHTRDQVLARLKARFGVPITPTV